MIRLDDGHTFEARIEDVLVNGDELGLVSLIEELVAATQAQAKRDGELARLVVEERIKADIAGRLTHIGLGELAKRIIPFGPDHFEIEVAGDWSPTLGELMLIGRTFATSAIEVSIEEGTGETDPRDCGDPTCGAGLSSMDSTERVLVIEVRGVSIELAGVV